MDKDIRLSSVIGYNLGATDETHSDLVFDLAVLQARAIFLTSCASSAHWLSHIAP